MAARQATLLRWLHGQQGLGEEKVSAWLVGNCRPGILSGSVSGQCGAPREGRQQAQPDLTVLWPPEATASRQPWHTSEPWQACSTSSPTLPPVLHLGAPTVASLGTAARQQESRHHLLQRLLFTGSCRAGFHADASSTQGRILAVRAFYTGAYSERGREIFVLTERKSSTSSTPTTTTPLHASRRPRGQRGQCCEGPVHKAWLCSCGGPLRSKPGPLHP